MNFLSKPDVRLLAFTKFAAWNEMPEDTLAWHVDAAASDAELLIEFAGRQCYESWENKAGRTNAAYIENIKHIGHTSVLEHASASIRFAAVSRTWSHEAVRHRHLSVSQLSQRYVDSSDINFVVPPALRGSGAAETRFYAACREALAAYRLLLVDLEARYAGVPDATLKKKISREAARSVLPNATETRLVLTGNLTAWRWFCIRRASQEADAEMCAVACLVLEILQQVAPGVFSDFEKRTSEKDGRIYYHTELHS